VFNIGIGVELSRCNRDLTLVWEQNLDYSHIHDFDVVMGLETLHEKMDHMFL
jgi:hypothetical protein